MSEKQASSPKKRNKADKASSRVQRLELIGNAVMHILALEGARKLTHRRVDRYLEFPEGTTSAYCRSRDDLLACGHGVLVSLSKAAFGELVNPLVESIKLQGDLSVLKISKVLAKTWAEYSDSVIMKAQLEFLIEAARSKDLHMLEGAYDREQHRAIGLIFESLGAQDSQAAAIEFCNWMRSEAWTDYLAPAGHARRPRPPKIMQDKIEEILARC